MEPGIWAPPSFDSKRAWLSPTAIWTLISFSWVSPIMHKAVKENVLQEDDAAKLLSADSRAPALAARFDAEFSACLVRFKRAGTHHSNPCI